MLCECGAQLSVALGEEVIRTMSGASLVFRRRTDYMLCTSCLKLYSVQRIRHPDSDDLPPAGAGHTGEWELEDRLPMEAEDDRLPLEDQFY